MEFFNSRMDWRIGGQASFRFARRRVDLLRRSLGSRDVAADSTFSLALLSDTRARTLRCGSRFFRRRMPRFPSMTVKP